MQKKKEKKEDKTLGMSALDDTLKALQTKFGEGAIMKMGDTPRVDLNVIPTGSLGLDMALGVGGIPRGRIIEIFGPESSGKTTLASHIVAEAQKLGGVCAYIDAEHAMDPEYTKKLGVKTTEVPVKYGKRTYGESKTRTLKMGWNYGIGALKVRLFGIR